MKDRRFPSLSSAARKTRLSMELPEISSNDMDMWDDILDCLMDRVLWGDRDFEEEELFPFRAPKLPTSSKSNLESPTSISSRSRPIPIPRRLARSENL